MAAGPITRYAKSGEVHIAYQVVGDGPVDVALIWGGLSHVEVMWDDPQSARFFEALASFCRLILFDKRGVGLSDRVSFGGLEERMDDIRAVLDAAGSERAFLVSESEGAALAALFASTAPDRVAGLVFYAPLVHILSEPDFPWGHDREQFEAYVRMAEDRWGDGTMMALHAPSSDSPGARAHWGRLERMAHTGEVEIRGDDVAGIAVNTAARVLAEARSGEVLVSRTVVDLVAGSGLVFDARGDLSLKGIPGTWQLFAVRE